MSLLAMIADNFELEQPPDDIENNNDEVDDVHERLLLMDMNSSTADNNDTTFTTAKGTDDSDDVSGNNEYVEYHDILKQQLRNDSEGTAETEQSLDSTNTTGSGINPQQAVHADDNASSSRSQEMKLFLTFLLMVVVGTGMKIFQKLQAIPYVNCGLHICTVCSTFI